MKRAVILINAYMQLPAQLAQAERIKEELERLDVHTDVLRNDGFFARIEGDEIRTYLPQCYDFCVYLDKDKYVSEALEKSGLILFNSHAAIRNCDDKMQTYLALSDKGIPMAKTLPGLLCYSPDAPIRESVLEKIETALGYPIVVKECFGSLGKGVYMAKDRIQLRDLAERLKCRPHLFQEAVQTSMGEDVRVIVVGGRYLCAMRRHSDADFRSNVELGGKAAAYTPSQAIVRVCEKTARILGLDYCGIDILLGEQETPIVCEVNSNAFFGGMESVTHVNVAGAYARYICEKVYG